MPVTNEPGGIALGERPPAGPGGRDPSGREPGGRGPGGRDPRGREPAGSDPRGREPAGSPPSGRDVAGTADGPPCNPAAEIPNDRFD